MIKERIEINHSLDSIKFQICPKYYLFLKTVNFTNDVKQRTTLSLKLNLMNETLPH